MDCCFNFMDSQGDATVAGGAPLVMPKAMLTAFFGRIKSQIQQLEGAVFEGEPHPDYDHDTDREGLNREAFSLESFENIASLIHSIVDREVDGVNASYQHSVELYRAANTNGSANDPSVNYNRAKALDRAILLMGSNVIKKPEKSLRIGDTIKPPS